MSERLRLRYETTLVDFHQTFTSPIGRLAHALSKAWIKVFERQITREEYLAVFDRPLRPGTNKRITVQEQLDLMGNGSLDPDQREQLKKIYKQHEDSIYIPKHTYLFSELHRLGAVVVVVTNGSEKVVREILREWKLIDYVVEVYGRGEGSILARNGIPSKPSPEVSDFVLFDLRRKGYPVHRHRTLMVGDYKDDIGAGNSAGINTAFVLTGPNQLPEDYEHRPTMVLLDHPSLQKPVSAWIREERAYLMRQLPDIVAGRID